jgi:hypothetical protein
MHRKPTNGRTHFKTLHKQFKEDENIADLFPPVAQ